MKEKKLEEISVSCSQEGVGSHLIIIGGQSVCDLTLTLKEKSYECQGKRVQARIPARVHRGALRRRGARSRRGRRSQMVRKNAPAQKNDSQ